MWIGMEKNKYADKVSFIVRCLLLIKINHNGLSSYCTGISVRTFFESSFSCFFFIEKKSHNR